MGKRVLVTGADGFIGSHLTERLVREGCEVRAFVFYNSFNSWGWLDHCAADVKGRFEVVAGDIRDAYAVRQAVSGCAWVFHLAALIAIPFSYQAPDTYIETNIRGSLNVVQAARECGVERVVHTSTSEVYGTARYVPIDEEHPLQAQSPYAASKIGADQIALSFQRSFGTPVIVIRPFNTYGPRQSARAVIPTIITQLAGGRERLTLGNLAPTRDFNYVADTVAGFLAAARAPGGLGEVVNIGSDYEIAIGDLARLIADRMGRRVELAADTERLRPEASEVFRLRASNRKARELLGWEPQLAGAAGLSAGLDHTIAWFREPANLARYKADIYNL